MGKRVAEVAGQRLARTLLELGGNNGVIVMPDADLEHGRPRRTFRRRRNGRPAMHQHPPAFRPPLDCCHGDRPAGRGVQAGQIGSPLDPDTLWVR